MLTRLFIRNYAIISELDIQLNPGLSIITGETGAGKSILLGALGLALGRRADIKIWTDENQKCIVEAHFKTNGDWLMHLFNESDLDNDEHLIFRREISSGGRSRSFINDTPVSLKLMQEIASNLIELHHQHDNLALQSKDYQIKVLDGLSNAMNVVDEYKKLYHQFIKLRNQLSELQTLEITSVQRKDFLQFQLDELTQANITTGEIARLEESENMLQHAEAIQTALLTLRKSLMDGPQAIYQQLTHVIRQMENIKNIPSFNTLIHRLDSLRIEVQDISQESQRMDGIAHEDPALLSKVQSRLNQLFSLIKKYHARNEEDLLAKYESIRNELSLLSSAKEQISQIESQLSSTFHLLSEKARELSDLRKAGAARMISSVQTLIHELGMPNGRFDVSIKSVPAGPDGTDDVQFLFSANKGMPLQPLQVIASGGELSRLSLALKSLYASKANLPTIVFDEIDTGISGEVAWRMGQLILGLAQQHQILMITHSPQIAAHATTQYHVSKVLLEGKDTSTIQLLTKEMRLTEIAKMLSGDPPSKEAIANARSLVSSIKN